LLDKLGAFQKFFFPKTEIHGVPILEYKCASRKLVPQNPYPSRYSQRKACV
jgi:hypothetical protein